MSDQKPILTKLESFKKVLANYEASAHAREVLSASPFVAMSGIAGGGRSNGGLDRSVVSTCCSDRKHGSMRVTRQTSPQCTDGPCQHLSIKTLLYKDSFFAISYNMALLLLGLPPDYDPRLITNPNRSLKQYSHLESYFLLKVCLILHHIEPHLRKPPPSSIDQVICQSSPFIHSRATKPAPWRHKAMAISTHQ